MPRKIEKKERKQKKDPYERAAEIKERLMHKYGNILHSYVARNPCAYWRLVKGDKDESKLCRTFLRTAECAEDCRNYSDLPLLRNE
jgi:hypothetical protein